MPVQPRFPSSEKSTVPKVAFSSRRVKRSFLGLAWAAALWAGLLLSSCGLSPVPPSPLARYEPAMKAEFRQELVELTYLPRYDITVDVDTDENLIQGQVWIDLTNTSPDPWPELIFRLYPMLEQYGGQVSIRSAFYNEGPVAFTFDAEGTALRLSLATPLESRQHARVGFIWSVKFPTWPDSPGVYALFGRSQTMYSLPLFYPSLAVYQPGPTMGTGRWWLDKGSVRGDSAYNYASFFAVTATLPSGQNPVVSGVPLSSTVLENGKVQHRWVTGPVREFVLHMSDQFEQKSVLVDGVTVSSYWLPGQAAAGQAALRYATAALRIFSTEFGPYPYTTMSVAIAPLTYRGMEYPGVHLLGVESYARVRSDLEFLTAHEVAHQWWFQLVHNDPVNAPWIDEGLAEYSVKLYYEALYGQTVADLIQRRRWEAPVINLEEQSLDAPLGQAVVDYLDSTQYEVIVYGKGALFFDQIRSRFGKRKFKEWLQSYVSDYRYQIITPDAFIARLQATDPTLTDTFLAEWLQLPAFP